MLMELFIRFIEELLTNQFVLSMDDNLKICLYFGKVQLNLLNQPLVLAHLSRRFVGKLIVYGGIRRPSVVRPSVKRHLL